jgi:hypothetical protein
VDNVFKNSSTAFRKFDFFEFAFNAPLPKNGFVLTSWTLGNSTSTGVICREPMP